MRRARLKVPADRPVGVYHCLSRVVDREFRLGDAEKEHFVKLLREYEAFCQVEVLTYCVMSNHFHLLVSVPRRPVVLPTAEEVLAQLRHLSNPQDLGGLQQHVAAFRLAGDAAGEADYLESFYARMWDLSQFMKALKQRFTQWYNTRTGRKGTLWEERFKSVVVEDGGRALGAMAAYIDLNPVRAGLVQDPKDYRWSGYGAALAGVKMAKERLAQVVERLGTKKTAPSQALARYRTLLYCEGTEEREAVDENGHTQRGALKREEVLRVLQAKGRLPLEAYVRCRVRYFCDGAALGSRKFVEQLFQDLRSHFSLKRKTGARRLRGLAGQKLYTVRDLRLRVFS